MSLHPIWKESDSLSNLSFTNVQQIFQNIVVVSDLHYWVCFKTTLFTNEWIYIYTLYRVMVTNRLPDCCVYLIAICECMIVEVFQNLIQKFQILFVFFLAKNRSKNGIYFGTYLEFPTFCFLLLLSTLILFTQESYYWVNLLAFLFFLLDSCLLSTTTKLDSDSRI